MATTVKKRPAQAPARMIRVPADVAKRARVYALNNDRKASAVIAEALEEYLKKRGA